MTRAALWLGSSLLILLPAEGDRIRVRPGEIVSLQGEIRYPRVRLATAKKSTAQPYLYSYTVRPAWYR